MKNIYSYNLNELEEYFIEIGEKKFRAKQVFEWLYLKRATSFEMMSNLSKTLIAHLQENFTLGSLTLLERQESSDGCVKYLFELEDKNCIETVLMRQEYGNSVCVSSQIGCNMGCVFCASGQIKKVRDLTAGEIVEQIIKVQQDLDEYEERVSHLVVMGIGEPFDNYDNVLQFIYIVNNAHGLAIGARHMTISTCGLIEGIKRFQNEPLQVNLAISLHSAIDAKRSDLMPINLNTNLKSLQRALIEYTNKTNRRVTFEYILLKGVNDSNSDATALADFVKPVHSYTNLIPYNQVNECGYEKVNRKDAMKFYDSLKKLKVNVTIRKEHGQDIDAACGQLRNKKMEDK